MRGDGSWVCRDWVGAVRVGVDAHVVGDLLVNAASATEFSTLDAGVVERRVVRAKVAAAAVPQRSH